MTPRGEGSVVSLSYRYVDQVDEVGNGIARFVMVPFDDIEMNGWDCCRDVDESARAGDAAPDEVALVPMSHWYKHELRDLTNGQLADIVISMVFAAGPRRLDGSFPAYTQLDTDLGEKRRALAKTILHTRGFSRQQVVDVESGRFWPED
jgi:hypothetical protein